jgi:hypothetical protein
MAVEWLVAQLNKLLTHYSSRSGLDIHMQVLMEVHIIEGGISTQILSEPFSWYGKWVMHCWLQSVWKKVDMFGFWIEIFELSIGRPLSIPCAKKEEEKINVVLFVT